MIVVSILVRAVGVAIVVNSIFSSGDAGQEFPRPGAPTARARRLMRALPVNAGVFLVLAGVVALLFAAAGGTP